MFLNKKCSFWAYGAVNYTVCCSNNSVVNWDRWKRKRKKKVFWEKQVTQMNIRGSREDHKWVVYLVKHFLVLLQARSASQERPAKRAPGHFALFWSLLRQFSSQYRVLFYFRIVVYQLDRHRNNDSESNCIILSVQQHRFNLNMEEVLELIQSIVDRFKKIKNTL